MASESAVNGTMIVDLPDVVTDAGELANVICGYTLEQRIGAGAFGEVWRAVSPGGLPKALKVLHGSYDSAAAETELRSLQLMRELRHPFLLSVERIEVDNGRLIIVTELADQNLEERFLELRDEGHKGISRDELLKFLHDAADALDFMHEQHNLQHLDIKPSNLLLQGGHVKVADFGLIKNLGQSELSMVSGFTPAYAPPELFHGRPGRNSDQYSLAIVYQVMLTGVPPFAGRTIAQLTAQHLSSKPDLSALSTADQAVVARALSKNPNARFPTCREFVDRLVKRSGGSTRAVPAKPAPTKRASAGGPPETPLSPGTDVVAPQVEAVPLPALNLDTVQATYRPTLFLGVGGLAGQVLASLRNRMAPLCKNLEPLSAFPFLYVDSDPQAIEAVVAKEHGAGLKRYEALPIPLRDRTHYRGLSSDLLEWLSRRWLFNIPRSGQVEGLRPLGRLTLVDHQREFREALRRALTSAVTAEAAREAEALLDGPVDHGALDVFVIASTCGGTGSGAVLDAAYLVRNLCEEMDLPVGELNGVLLHVTSHRDPSPELRSANTVSCLKELGCYSAPERGYPGDRGCALPGSLQSPFDHAHFVHLGENVTRQDLKAEIDRVAEFVYRNAATDARSFFRANRSTQTDAESMSIADVHIRTFGVLTLDDLAGHDDRARAVALARAFLKRCSQHLGNAKAGPAATPARQFGATLARELHLDIESLLQSAAAVFQGELGNKVSRYVLQRTKQETEATQSLGLLAQLQSIDADFAAAHSDQLPGGHPARILAAFRQHLDQAAQRASACLLDRLREASADPERGWTFASEALGAVVTAIEESRSGISARAAKTSNELKQLHDRLGGHVAPSRKPAEAEASSDQSEFTPIVQHAMLRFGGYVFQCLYDHARQVCGVLEERLDTLRKELAGLDETLAQSLPARKSGPNSDLPDAQASPVQPQAVQAFERSLCLSRSVQWCDLTQQVTSQSSTAGLLVKCALGSLLSGEPASREASAKSPAPILAQVGGGRRVLAVIAETSEAGEGKTHLESEFGECVTVQQAERGDHFVCCEVKNIDLERVVGTFARQGDRVLDLASRVHTRIDVSWNDFA